MTYQISSMNVVTAESVGEWGGREEVVATNHNRINEAIASLLDCSDDDGFYRATSEVADKFGTEEWLGYPLNDDVVDALASHIVNGTALDVSTS